MTSKLSISVIGLALFVALATAFGSSSVASARSAALSTQRTHVVNLQIQLKVRHAFPHAAGSSQYQSQPGQSEFQVEVEHVRALVGKQLLVKAATSSASRWSRNVPITAAGCAPTKPVTGLPSRKTATVGMLWMP